MKLRNILKRSFDIKFVILSVLSLFFLTPSCKNKDMNITGTEPFFYSENIFPFQDKHVHSSTIVELPNGDLLTGWFQGSGERGADDVLIMGARKKNGKKEWSQPFILADVKGFPDCNPLLFLDGKKRLWLMWYTVMAGQWETSLLKYRISEDYIDMSGAPNWKWQEDLHIRLVDKAERGILPGDPFVESVKRQLDEYGNYIKSSLNQNISSDRWNRNVENILYNVRGENMIGRGTLTLDNGQIKDTLLGYPYFRRMGWQTRNKPIITKSGRMIIPLYSDGLGFSLMTFTDDLGESWGFSNPLAVALSEDEGKTWSWHKYIVSEDPSIEASYPAIIEGADGLLHVSFSNQNKQQTITYTAFNESWVKSK